MATTQEDATNSQIAALERANDALGQFILDVMDGCYGGASTWCLFARDILREHAPRVYEKIETYDESAAKFCRRQNQKVRKL